MPLDADPLPAAEIDDHSQVGRGRRTGRHEAEGRRTHGRDRTRPLARSGSSTSSSPRRPRCPKTANLPGPLELTLPVGPLPPVAAVAFSPDGKLLAIGTYGRVTVWDLATAKPVKVLTNVLGAVNDLKFSPDGKLLAVAGGQPSARGDLRLFDTTDWKLAALARRAPRYRVVRRVQPGRHEARLAPASTRPCASGM